jgi:hypothetical protein
LTSVDVGNTLRARVLATNSAGSGAAVSAPTTVVSSKAPKSISLDANQSIVVFGGSTMLTGAVSNGSPGESVTIVEHLVPAVRGLEVRDVATVQTTASGSFSLAVRPIAHTLFKATTGETSSNAVSVYVRPQLLLTHVGFHRFQLQAYAARSFRGRYGLLERWSSSRQRWTVVRRVVFTGAFAQMPTTMVSSALFRARPVGVHVRVILPRSQAAPWYLTGISNSTTA